MPAFAWQSSPPIPPAAEPAPRRDRDITPEERETVPRLDLELPENRETLDLGGPDFIINEISLTGVTAYQGKRRDRLDGLYADDLGKAGSLNLLYEIAARIERQYREDGYIFTRVVVPTQTAQDGVFELQIVEGFVSNIIIQGKPGNADRLVSTILNRIQDVQPLTNARIERALLLINDIPGVSARGFLRPAGGVLGAAELVVDVNSSKLDAFLVADNYGSRFAGPFGVAVGVQVNSLTPLGDQTELVAFNTLAPFDEQRTFQLSYSQYLWRDISFGIRAAYSEGAPGFSLEELGVVTESISASAFLSYPWIRTRDLNLITELGIDFFQSDADLVSGPFNEDDLRVVRATVDLNVNDRFGGINDIRVEGRAGFNVLGATPGDFTTESRVGADGQFFSVIGRISRVQRLLGGFDLFVAVGGQYSDDIVLANEEYGVGNANFGRGFDPSELSGPFGAGATVELRYSRAMDWAYLDSFQAYGFGDLGAVWIDEGEDGFFREELFSTGVGLQLNLTSWLSVSGEFAVRLTQDLPTREDETNPFQGYFRVVARY